MRKLFFFAIVLVVFSLCPGCIKDQSNNITVPPDDIYYQKLNDTLIGVKNDTLNIFSSSALAIFQIYKTGKSVKNIYGVRIQNKPTGILCDCGHDFLCVSSKGYLNALNYNDFITGNGLWGSLDSLYNLSDFSGKGERYLGFQFINFSSGISIYNYGWVKLYCSADNDTLIIIDYAGNRTANNGIKAEHRNK